MQKTVYFCGIGGSGMSALARFFLAEGAKVWGSDTHESETTCALSAEGAKIFLEQKKENLEGKEIDLFIFTEAIPEENEERKMAETMGVKMQKYFEALGEISKNFYTIAVAGTHGKSSTTAMLGTILAKAGLETTVIVGANVHDWGGKNFLRANEGASGGHPAKKYLVVEACEYRKSFLNLNISSIVITNVEPDHPDFFRSNQEYFGTFKELLLKMPPFGFFAAFMDGKNMMEICPPNFHPRRFPAFEEENLVPPLQVYGNFQRKNAACAMAAARALRVEESVSIEALKTFSGLSRRFEKKGEKNGIVVIDDYAHHPTAVKATLEAARDMIRLNKRKKLWVVFQPHQHSRTAEFLKEFSEAFFEADELLIPNIYAARDTEEDKKRISAEQFSMLMENAVLDEEKRRSNVWGRGTTTKRTEVFYKKRVRYTENFRKTLEILEEDAYNGDVIVVMGAGDVSELATQFLKS